MRLNSTSLGSIMRRGATAGKAGVPNAMNRVGGPDALGDLLFGQAAAPKGAKTAKLTASDRRQSKADRPAAPTDATPFAELLMGQLQAPGSKPAVVEAGAKPKASPAVAPVAVAKPGAGLPAPTAFRPAAVKLASQAKAAAALASQGKAAVTLASQAKAAAQAMVPPAAVPAATPQPAAPSTKSLQTGPQPAAPSTKSLQTGPQPAPLTAAPNAVAAATGVAVEADATSPQQQVAKPERPASPEARAEAGRKRSAVQAAAAAATVPVSSGAPQAKPEAAMLAGQMASASVSGQPAERPGIAAAKPGAAAQAAAAAATGVQPAGEGEGGESAELTAGQRGSGKPAAASAPKAQNQAAARFDAAIGAAQPPDTQTSDAPVLPDAMPAPLDAAAAPADQIAQQVRLVGQGDQQRIVVELDPPELGRVVVEIRADGDGVRAVLEVENPRTLEQLRREAPALAQRLAEGGIELRHVEFTLSTQSGPPAHTGWQQEQSFAQSWQQPSARQPSAAAFAGGEGPGLAAAESYVSDSGINLFV